MGCSASKQVSGSVVLPQKQQHSKSKKLPTDRVASSGSATTATSSSKTIGNNNNGEKVSSHSKHGKGPMGIPHLSREVVRRGYSSGASSLGSSGGSDGSEHNAWVIDEEIHAMQFKVSKHSTVLALGAMRDEFVAEGDLAKCVVRIETPFDTPIEQIYSGVHDGPVLGSGVSGIVRLVVHRSTGIKYAVKCLDLDLIESTEGVRRLRDEIFIMCQLDHPNIVRIEEVYESPSEIYIVQELALGGDLFDRLDEQPDFHYSEAQCARLVKQMLSSVRYLHSKGIIHRDLKLENFLFSTKDNDSELRMIDFGLSKHFQVGQCHNEQVGTPYTVAPEIINGKYDEKCDVWSLGVITYLLLSGETPFGGLDGENLLLVKQNILRAKLNFKPKELWDTVSDDGKDFVKLLLNPDPTKRPTVKEAQRAPWIQIWAKKDVANGNKLNPKTLSALMQFKESSDMQKLLSEVLSYTLLPEQIVDLRQEFEKIDTDGDGEITLLALKNILMENAEAGALGALTELEVEDIFDSIRLRKSEPTIRWHEFLAAGLSQARVDDRNLRLAFDRIDTQRKGFITFDDLTEILGSAKEYEELEKMWLESLEECKVHLERVTFDDFKKIMKGRPAEVVNPPSFAASSSISSKRALPTVIEGENVGTLDLSEMESLLGQKIKNPRKFYSKKRSCSCDQTNVSYGSWDAGESNRSLDRDDLSISKDEPVVGTIDTDSSTLVNNRTLYRKHREMRLAVLDASKQFDKKRHDYQAQKDAISHPRLIMKRGAKPPIAIEDAHTRALFEAAAQRAGRGRRQRNKTSSDVTGLLIKALA